MIGDSEGARQADGRRGFPTPPFWFDDRDGAGQLLRILFHDGTSASCVRFGDHKKLASGQGNSPGRVEHDDSRLALHARACAAPARAAPRARSRRGPRNGAASASAAAPAATARMAAPCGSAPTERTSPPAPRLGPDSTTDPREPELPDHMPQEVRPPAARVDQDNVPVRPRQLEHQTRDARARPDVEERRDGLGQDGEQHQRLDDEVPDAGRAIAVCGEGPIRSQRASSSRDGLDLAGEGGGGQSRAPACQRPSAGLARASPGLGRRRARACSPTQARRASGSTAFRGLALRSMRYCWRMDRQLLTSQ